MIRKQKWEIEFEEYNEQEEILKINELSAKFEEKNITKEEYKELKKSYAKYKNIKKVANIIELKKQLEKYVKFFDELSDGKLAFEENMSYFTWSISGHDDYYKFEKIDGVWYIFWITRYDPNF